MRPSNLKKHLWSFLPFALSLVTTSPALSFDNDGMMWKQQNAILVVLDISGSMDGSPLNDVRNELSAALNPNVFPKDGAAGLISFSGCSSSDVNIEVPLAPGNASAVVQRAFQLRAHGATDLARAMMLARDQAKAIGNNYCTKILVLTDGQDTCGLGNVSDISRDIAQLNECNQINAISIGQVNIAQELNKMVTEGRGFHRQVEDTFIIGKVLEELMQNFNLDSAQIGSADWKMGDAPAKKDTKPGKKKDGRDQSTGNESPVAPDPNSNKNEQEKWKSN